MPPRKARKPRTRSLPPKTIRARRQASARKRGAAMADKVRRAVGGTLNLDVPVKVARLEDGLWGVTMVMGRHCSPPVFLRQWEMDALLEVTLVPAHKRGIFMRLYRNLAAAAGQTA